MFISMRAMNIIDTHCHLDFEVFNADRGQVLQEAHDCGLIGIIVPGTHRQGWHNLFSVCSAHEELYPALGLHPMFLEQHHESDIEILEQMIDQTRSVAIGEIGLDYRNSERNEHQQKYYFEQQILLTSKK